MRTLVRNTLGALLKTAALVLLPLGCKHTPRERLQGRWLGETIERVPVDQMQKATDWVRGMAIEFTGGKVTVSVPAETPRSGTFRVARAEGDELVVNFLRSEGQQDEAVFRFLDESRIAWQLGDGRRVVLRKSRN